MKNYMLGLAFICSLFIISTSQANIVNIDVLSESHHIFGSAGQDDPNFVYNTYDLISNNPVHYRADGTSDNFISIDPNVAESWAGNFRVETYTLRWYSYAVAESTYTFQPKNGSLIIDAEAVDGSNHQFHDLWLSLVDLSTGQLVLFDKYDMNHPNNYTHYVWDTHVIDQYVLAVDTQSIYELHLYATGWGGDFNALTYVDVSMATVPEPTTILLMVTGLVGLGFTGRKTKHKA